MFRWRQKATGAKARVTAQRAWGPQGWSKAVAKLAFCVFLPGGSFTQLTLLSRALRGLFSHLSCSWAQD